MVIDSNRLEITLRLIDQFSGSAKQIAKSIAELVERRVGRLLEAIKEVCSGRSAKLRN
jgi:hypothetical protein